MENTEHPEHIVGAQTDPYEIDVETAALLLGVGTTRLSQITSRGSLSFQRRKVGIRNRMFYRRSELMEYLEKQFPNSPQFKSQMLMERWGENPTSEEEITPHQDIFQPILDVLTNLSKNTSQKGSQSLSHVSSLNTKNASLNKNTKHTTKPSAISLREKQDLNHSINTIITELSGFRHVLQRIEQKLDSLSKLEHSLERKIERKIERKTSNTLQHAQQKNRIQPPIQATQTAQAILLEPTQSTLSRKPAKWPLVSKNKIFS